MWSVLWRSMNSRLRPLILENSQVVVLWGMNPLNTLKLRSSTDEQGLEYFHQLKNLANQ